MAQQDLLDRGTMIHNLDGFAHRWREQIDSWDLVQRGRSESSFAQTFWSDLLRQFGVVPERMALFEQDAVRATTGRSGSIDVFWSGVFLGEAKSVGKDLDAAYKQALDYLSGGSIKLHEFPKFVVVTDFEYLRVTRLGDGDTGWTDTFTLDNIAEHVDQLSFLAGHETVTAREEQDASIDAARIMATLYEAMTGSDADNPVDDDAAADPSEEDARVEQASVFLTRILFLLYGDDAGLWRADLFYDFVLNYTRSDGTDLGAQLHQLFNALNTHDNKRSKRLPNMLAQFPYVNGSLFTDYNQIEYFDADMREALLDACRFRWTRISPAVFGSMFQLVKSKEARRAAGEHYTTETNILKTIGPLFLDDLQAEADRLTRNKSTTMLDLRGFRDALATNSYGDVAAGCGNFLVVAYRELRRIETNIIVEIRRREGLEGIPSLDATLETKLTIGQFYGIEVNWWPAKIAETAMFLVDHQANRELAAAIGQAPERLPITITAHIHHTNALTTGWDALIPEPTGKTYLFSNPPFLGHATRTEEQAQELRDAWGTRDISRLDFVTAWHAKALDFFSRRSGDWAFVATNSISQGDQVPRLFGAIFGADWRIKFAHRTFAWNSGAPGKAAVHCVIVGFTKDRAGTARLFDYPDLRGRPVETRVRTLINAYLVDGPNVLVTKRAQPLSPDIALATFGSMPRDGGHLVVNSDEYEAVSNDPVARTYLRPFKMGRELVHSAERWCLWLADLDPADVSKSSVLRERLESVRLFREDSRAGSTREYARQPHLFVQRAQPETSYVGVPAVVSERRMYYTVQRLDASVIAGNKIYTVVDPDGLQFALLSSSMFITWQKTIGGRLKSDVSFASTLTWNTFPVPPLDAATRAAVIKAGHGVLDARALHPERSLADHYNPLAMDPALLKAHDVLDREVDRLFGAPRRLTAERQRLELLFQSYRDLTRDDD